MDFILVKNTSMPCAELAVDEQGNPRPFLPTTDEYLLWLLQLQGGHFLKNYMARNLPEADANFPSMLTLDQASQVPSS